MDTREIGGRTFEFDDLPFGVALEVLTRTSNVAGGAIAIAMQAADPEHSLESASNALSDLLSKINHADLMWLAAKFGAVSRCDGATITAKSVDKVFRGRTGDFFLWLRACYEVHFDDFFAALGSFAAGAPPALGSQESSA